MSNEKRSDAFEFARELARARHPDLWSSLERVSQRLQKSAQEDIERNALNNPERAPISQPVNAQGISNQ